MDLMNDLQRTLSDMSHATAEGVYHIRIMAKVVHKKPIGSRQTNFEKLLFAISCIKPENVKELLDVAQAIIDRQIKENMQIIKEERKAERKAAREAAKKGGKTA